ncbi:unnamed protein product [Amoebophrya sp. A120]|nr:unnamed protein product [Amoebophrya sp. A120]|eukprot:GSA120T00005992001.1
MFTSIRSSGSPRRERCLEVAGGTKKAVASMMLSTVEVVQAGNEDEAATEIAVQEHDEPHETETWTCNGGQGSRSCTNKEAPLRPADENDSHRLLFSIAFLLHQIHEKTGLYFALEKKSAADPGTLRNSAGRRWCGLCTG